MSLNDVDIGNRGRDLAVMAMVKCNPWKTFYEYLPIFTTKEFYLF